MPLTYAIGDIHGSLDKLEQLLAQCGQHAGGAPMRWIFLGDYIDRGADSRGVIEALIALQARTTGAVVTLMGNHEAMALTVLDGRGSERVWLMQGGLATLESYGARSIGELPHVHLEWLRALRLSFDDGRRFFAHAGIIPTRRSMRSAMSTCCGSASRSCPTPAPMGG